MGCQVFFDAFPSLFDNFQAAGNTSAIHVHLKGLGSESPFGQLQKQDLQTPNFKFLWSGLMDLLPVFFP
jgi:hypothetical protein